jgi:hypothetical protein
VGDSGHSGTADADWAERRRRAVAQHGAELDRRRSAEVAEARRLVADFARAAHARGLRLTALTARAYNGRATYRTGLRGWYLRPDRSLAVGADGGFYVLTVPASLRARVTGVVVQPQDPRLIVGEGGRDGESMPLAALLRQRLDAGDDWP